MFDLKDKIIVVTGGLGQLGSNFSKALTEQGAKVAIIDLAIPTQLPDNLKEADKNGRLMVIAADQTDKKQLEVAASKIVSKWGVPHGLVNNAALDSPPDAPLEENGPFETYPSESFEKVMNVNVKGVMHCCQVFGDLMAKENRGSIVNVASIYGTVSPDQNFYEYRRQRGENFYKPVAYSASKSALYNLTRYIATYWGRKNVRVNTVTFGGVFNNQDETFLGNYNARVPLGRMADENEYNGAIVFLMSDASTYMTGSNMVLDGGFTAW